MMDLFGFAQLAESISNPVPRHNRTNTDGEVRRDRHWNRESTSSGA
jgi:hypothetical protein